MPAELDDPNDFDHEDQEMVDFRVGLLKKVLTLETIKNHLLPLAGMCKNAALHEENFHY